jgi:hypothetical protein
MVKEVESSLARVISVFKLTPSFLDNALDGFIYLSYHHVELLASRG